MAIVAIIFEFQAVIGGSKFIKVEWGCSYCAKHQLSITTVLHLMIIDTSNSKLAKAQDHCQEIDIHFSSILYVRETLLPVEGHSS